MTINQRLQQARETAQMSQQTVAKALFVTRQTVSRWEQGHTLPNIYVLQDLAKLYGCTLDELVGTVAVSSETPVPVSQTQKRVNWLALFGLAWFNLIVALGFIITVAALVFSLWVVVISFIVSPGLVIGGKLVFALPISWWQLPLAVLVCAVGVGLWQPALRVTHEAWQRFVAYLRYNQQAVYSN